jgi:hypothetical protein
MSCTTLPQGCPPFGSFVPAADAVFVAQVVTANIEFPMTGQALTCLVFNAGPEVAYVQAGNTQVVATLQSAPVQPSQWVAIAQGTFSNLAAITASGTAALQIQSGTGNPLMVYGQVTVVRPLVPYSGPDVGQITTPGTAVTAFKGGEIVNGAVIVNPPAPNTNTIWVDPVAVATTTAGGSTIALPPGASAVFDPPPSGDITVNSTAAATFSGWRY